MDRPTLVCQPIITTVFTSHNTLYILSKNLSLKKKKDLLWTVHKNKHLHARLHDRDSHTQYSSLTPGGAVV